VGAQRLLYEKCSEPKAVAQRSEGLRRRSRVMQYRREPDVRQEIKRLFTVRSAAEFGSVDARRVAGTADRRNTSRAPTTATWPPPARGARGVIVRERRRPATLVSR
jgi:hypothetical protein